MFKNLHKMSQLVSRISRTRIWELTAESVFLNTNRASQSTTSIFQFRKGLNIDLVI